MENFCNPRKPTKEEIQDLKKYLRKQGLHREGINNLVSGKFPVTVFGGYTSDTPGYAGKLIVMVPGEPNHPIILGYRDSELVRLNSV